MPPLAVSLEPAVLGVGTLPSLLAPVAVVEADVGLAVAGQLLVGRGCVLAATWFPPLA